jgi:type II secretory pathway pseudopilin PulG
MRGGIQKQGYTIVEVMIFLAVSGLMFIMAAGFINGKQNRAEFRQGMNDINSQIQQTINDVSNGVYPSNGGFACSADNLGSAPTFSGTANGTGTNKGCAFIGKVMQFGVGTTDSPTYNVYSIIGRQFQTDDKSLLPPTNFQQVKPVAMTGAGGSRDLTQSQNLKWGLHVDEMFNGTDPIGAFGFFAGFATTSVTGSDTNLDSGATIPIIIPIPGSQLGQNDTNMYTQINSLSSAATVIDTDPEIIMCFRGGARQFGRLTIGTTDNIHGQKLATHIQISDGAPSAGCPA